MLSASGLESFDNKFSIILEDQKEGILGPLG